MMVMGTTEPFGNKEKGNGLAKMRRDKLGELVMVCPNSKSRRTNESLVSKHT